MPDIDWPGLKEKIKEYAVSVGIDKIGFTDAQPLTGHLPRLLKRINTGYRCELKLGSPEKRVDPSAHLKDAKSVISVAVAYPWGDPPIYNSGRGRGRISFISRGRDYHAVVKSKLEKLRSYILSEAPQAKIITMVDTEELLEKAMAVKAGLGWFGKHTLLVTPEYGSWVCLGELITDLPFPPDRPIDGDCGGCRKCIDSCPTKALDEDKNLDPDRCLAGLTQSKGLFQPELRELMGNTLYGCDICQTACPQNKKAKPAVHKEFTYEHEDAFPLLSDLFGMTDADFKRRFGHTSGAWRGRTPIQRNAVIAAGNLKDRGAVPALVKILTSDSRSVMRGAAAWALGKIGVPEGIEALKRALENEKDPVVLEEIEEAFGE